MSAKKDLKSATNKAKSDISGAQTSEVANNIIENVNVVKFPKPHGDYFKLDLVLRETVMGNNNHMVITKDIKRDYRAYLQSVCGNDGITKYIHGLIEEDAKKNGYKF